MKQTTSSAFRLRHLGRAGGPARRVDAGPRRSRPAAPEPVRQGVAGRRADGDHRRLQQPRRERAQDLGRPGPLRPDVARGRERGHQGHVQQGRHLRGQAGAGRDVRVLRHPGQVGVDGRAQQEGRSGRHRARLQAGPGSPARAGQAQGGAVPRAARLPRHRLHRRQGEPRPRVGEAAARDPDRRRDGGAGAWRTSRPPSTAPGGPTPTRPATCSRTRRTTTPGSSYIDQSLALKEDWFNLWIKAQLLAAKGNHKEAVPLAERAYAARAEGRARASSPRTRSRRRSASGRRSTGTLERAEVRARWARRLSRLATRHDAPVDPQVALDRRLGTESVSARGARRRPCGARSAGRRAAGGPQAAIPSTSPTGRRKPTSPSATTSGRPPTSEATTGTPQASASSAARPKLSLSLGSRKRSASASARRQVDLLAEEVDVGRQPEPGQLGDRGGALGTVADQAQPRRAGRAARARRSPPRRRRA